MKNPKRSIKKNAWGNVVGYEGRERVAEFGDNLSAAKIAEIWAANPGMTVNEAIEEYYSK